jgi:uncharacterized protein (DUF2141 family)
MRRSELLLLAMTLALTSPAIAKAADSAPQNVVHVELLDFRNDNGVAGCLLFSSAEGFPTDASKAIKSVGGKIANHHAVCDFADVAPGQYAIAAMHDENSNGKVDTNFLGIPTEGVGASNDAKGFMGPPKFNDAHFEFKGGRLDLAIHIRYLL